MVGSADSEHPRLTNTVTVKLFSKIANLSRYLNDTDTSDRRTDRRLAVTIPRSA